MDYAKEIERLNKLQSHASIQQSNSEAPQPSDVPDDHFSTLETAPLSDVDKQKAKRILFGTISVSVVFLLWFAWRNFQGVWDGYYLKPFHAMFVVFPLIMAIFAVQLGCMMSRRIEQPELTSSLNAENWRKNVTRWSWVIPVVMVSSFASEFLLRDGIPVGQLLGRTKPTEVINAVIKAGSTVTTSDPTYPAVLQATDRGDIAAIAQLKSNHQDVQAPNTNGYTALHLAAARGAVPTMIALLDAGALVNAPALGIQGHGRTPLDSAVFEDKVEAVKLLLTHGARIAAADQGGWIALHYAVHHRANQSLTVLLEAAKQQGVDLNARAMGSRGETALMKAAERSHLEGIRLLVNAGAQIDTLDKHGKNALDYAEFFKQKEASDLLCSLGAKPTALDTTAPNNEVSKRSKC